MGRAILAKGVELEPLTDGDETGGASRRRCFGGLGNMFSLSMEYLPRGFLQMIYIDTNGFDKQHYKFDYVRREFLGEVRTLVFDVTPAGQGRQGALRRAASGSRIRTSTSSGSTAPTAAARAPTTTSTSTAGA